jgi:hypothetical protein
MRMIRSLAILVMTILACCVVEAQTTNSPVFFRATVQDLVMLSNFSGKAIPAAVDPRYAMTVRIESVGSGVTNFTAGAVVIFAIHSPALLFAGEEAKGKTYDFTLFGKTENGRIRYFDLEKQKKQPSTNQITREQAMALVSTIHTNMTFAEISKVLAISPNDTPRMLTHGGICYFAKVGSFTVELRFAGQ